MELRFDSDLWVMGSKRMVDWFFSSWCKKIYEVRSWSIGYSLFVFLWEYNLYGFWGIGF